jgi:hypothetical protein
MLDTCLCVGLCYCYNSLSLSGACILFHQMTATHSVLHLSVSKPLAHYSSWKAHINAAAASSGVFHSTTSAATSPAGHPAAATSAGSPSSLTTRSHNPDPNKQETASADQKKHLFASKRA